MSDLTTSPDVVAYMHAATSEKDWKRRCEQVKKANGGKFPAFWNHTITKNMYQNLKQRFGKDW